MNKKITIILVVLIGLIGFAAVYLMRDMPGEVDSTVETGQVQTTGIQMETPQMVSTSGGVYKGYDEPDLAKNDDTKILFFHAAWCPQCRELEADILKGPIPDDLTIYKVDYDTNQGLRKKYGVALQTTLVKVDNQGNLVKKFVAYDDPSLNSLVANLLP